MYIVTIHNIGAEPIPIHNSKEKLTSGKVTKGINTIDSFQFSMLPSNAGFNEIYDYTTLVTVYNTNRNRYEFFGRALYSEDTMSDNGAIKKEVICESYLGFFCDSQQEYVPEQNWTVGGLLQHIVNTHNAQVESYKQFTIGEVTVTDPNDNVYCGIQRENTWETLKKKLLDVLGGEIRFRVEGDVIYLDYLVEIGEKSSTEIALSRNMKSIAREKDPSEIVTRLIPLGCKLKGTDNKGKEVETEYRLDISSVNNGKKYIDDETAIAIYGIRVATVEFDDVTVASTLLKKGEDWLIENNKLAVSYTITALDLSLIGLDADDFEVCNYYPVKNALLGIDDTIRVIKKNIDICEEIKSTLEFGDNFETLSASMKRYSDELGLITANYVTNLRFENAIEKTSTLIEQTEENIRLEVRAQYTDLSETVSEISLGVASIDMRVTEMSGGVNELSSTVSVLSVQVGSIDMRVTEMSGGVTVALAELELKVGRDENDHIISMINASADVITLNSNRLIINSSNFKLQKNGTVVANAITINGGTLSLPSGEDKVEIGAERGMTITASGFSDAHKSRLRYASDRIAYMSVDSDGKNHAMPVQITFYGYSDYTASALLGGTWESTSAIAVISDATKKKNIESLDTRYETFFDNIEARRFQYKDGTSGRYHTGYITQEIQEALNKADITEKEFAGICTFNQGGEDESSALRYGEFVSLNTWQIQKLKKRIAELETKINELGSGESYGE